MKTYYVYIVTNPRRHTVLYTGVTNNLERRMQEHQQGLFSGFSKKYNCTKLVYYDVTNDIDLAIEEEKRIKGGSRKRKIALIESINPNWVDLMFDPGTLCNSYRGRFVPRNDKYGH
ncbi:GIY-YIG nuclease family protein [Candidatus Uhrbacteria bacterium]|nr:GIY-YIG nuclease family protein [Candidatus Uhrbacteria bacterium]